MIKETYDLVEVVGEDPLVTFDEFKSQCYKDCADASFEEVKSQWDDMLEEQHKDARKRVKDKDGQFMLALVGQGKKVMRDVVGSGTRTCDVDRQSFQDDPVIQMLGGGSNATGQTCSRTRLSALFSSPPNAFHLVLHPLPGPACARGMIEALHPIMRWVPRTAFLNLETLLQDSHQPRKRRRLINHLVLPLLQLQARF